MSTALSAQDIINRAQKDNKRTFPYIWRGKLNMACLRENRESTGVEVSNEEWLNNSKLVRGQSLDRVEFSPQVAFKVTLDFKEVKETLNMVECEERGMPFNTRETTDWILLTCIGDRAFYDRNMKKLVLLHCVASSSVTHDFMYPCTVILSFEEDEWTAERVFSN